MVPHLLMQCFGKLLISFDITRPPKIAFTHPQLILPTKNTSMNAKILFVSSRDIKIAYTIKWYAFVIIWLQQMSTTSPSSDPRFRSQQIQTTLKPEMLWMAIPLLFRAPQAKLTRTGMWTSARVHWCNFYISRLTLHSVSNHFSILMQWNLPVTTTSIIKSITCDLFSNVF